VWLAGAASQDAQNALVLAIVAAVAGLLVAICTGIFQVWAAKQNHSNQIPENAQTMLFERTAVLSSRADDADDRDEAQDRRLDVIERHLDLDNINWRVGHDD
jgi:Na+/glutamate symporter